MAKSEREGNRLELEKQGIEFVLLYGRPSAGKGTQAALLEEMFPDDVALIATGDIFRSANKTEHPLHERYRRFAEDTADIGAIMKSGGLVPDERMFPFSFDETAVQIGNGKKVIVLDGVIRTPKQLDDFMNVFVPNFAQDLDVSVRHLFFDTPLEAVLERAETRRNADIAGGREPRPDDSEDTVRKRQRTFDEETMPLINELRRLGQLHEIDGSRSIEEVSRDVKKIVFEGGSSIKYPEPRPILNEFEGVSTIERLAQIRQQHPLAPIEMESLVDYWTAREGFNGAWPETDMNKATIAAAKQRLVYDVSSIQSKHQAPFRRREQAKRRRQLVPARKAKTK